MTRVLIVEDEALLAMMLEDLLHDEGFEVSTAGNGKEGLATLREDRPDVVLLDMMMPVMDGPAMLRAMEADTALAGIPVIIISSLPEQTVRERVDGYAAYLRKPALSQSLLATISDVLATNPH